MMGRSAHLAAAWLLLLASGQAFAQEPEAPGSDEELRAAVQAAGGAEGNGGADLVIVFRRTRVDVEGSGLGHIHDHELIKCLSEKGAAELARVRLNYDPSSNHVELRLARILRSTGSVEDVSPDLAIDLPQPQQAIYWGARMKLLPLPRLQPGDALELKTYMKGFLIAYLGEGGAKREAGGGTGELSRSDARFIPPMRGHFYDVVSFQDRYPMKLRHYKVQSPRDKPIRFEVYGQEVMSCVGFDEEHFVYRFWKQDIDAWKEEPHAVAASDLQPKVVLATVPDWPTKSRWFYQVNEGQFEANEAIRARVAELTRRARDDEAKVAAIVHWAADNIRYSGISMGKGEGYTLHPGSMIYEDRSGVCKDKAAMAITMLRAAGFRAFPAMTMAGARVERVPADQFNHCVVALEEGDGGFRLLDPTWVVFSPELWSSAEGEQHYLIGTEKGEDLARTRSYDPASLELHIRSRASLDAQGNLKGVLEISGKGYTDQRLRRELVHYSTARDRQAWFQELVGNIGAAAVVEKVRVSYPRLRDLSQPIRYEIRYRVPGFAMVGKDRLFFSPPCSRHLITNPRLAPYLGTAEAEKRTQPLLFWAPRLRRVEESIELPPGFKVVRLPEDRSLDGPAASLTTRVQVRGRHLEHCLRLVLESRQVPVEDYASFRELMQETEGLHKDLVVLERKR